jgi:hypothetical protein
MIYYHIFKEYFNYKTFYVNNNTSLLFYSFLAVTFTALFNPVLESPIYASSYWIILGFLSKAINMRENRKKQYLN